MVDSTPTDPVNGVCSDRVVVILMGKLRRVPMSIRNVNYSVYNKLEFDQSIQTEHSRHGKQNRELC